MKVEFGKSWSSAPNVLLDVPQEFLPFRVRLAVSEEDLIAAACMRVSAFNRHAPEIAAGLVSVEDEDRMPDVAVLLAERKLDSAVVGTIRVQPNFHRPLRVEGEVELPSSHRGRRLMETTRLGVEAGRAGHLVMFALVKAAFAICRATRVDYGVALGRAAMSPLFRGMQYDDLFGHSVPISYASNVPHWIYSIPIPEVLDRLRAAKHPLHRFMAMADHPDLTIDLQGVGSNLMS